MKGWPAADIADLEAKGRVSSSSSAAPKQRRSAARGRRSKALEAHQWRTERAFQEAAMSWLRGTMALPAFAVTNAMGAKYKPEAGIVAGIPDICLAKSSGPYGALFIELKLPDNDLSAAQEAQIRALMAAGNACIVCYDMGQVKTFTHEYLHSPGSFVGGV